MTVREALQRAVQRLDGLSDTPRLDAELLLAEAIGIDREQLLLQSRDRDVPAGFETLLERRCSGEPVAYILGRRAFWTVELAVAPGVLIPRPDSETLIEAALDRFGAEGPARILDLGTGPGTLLLAALDQWPRATGIGVDRSEVAIGLAASNAERLGLADRASLRRGDWAEGIEETFDLILCNPPYVEEAASLPRDVRDWEPAEALFAGAQGLDDYVRLAPQIGPLLAPGGIACIEIGVGQARSVPRLFEAQELAVEVRPDLGGRPRCLIVSQLI